MHIYPICTCMNKQIALLSLSGPRDAVQCFFCGVGLEDWEEDDDPWVEHASHAPHCTFLILNKGRGFRSQGHQISTHLDSQQVGTQHIYYITKLINFTYNLL